MTMKKRTVFKYPHVQVMAIITLMGMLISCEKEITPLIDTEQQAFVNFFDASEVLRKSKFSASPIYINDSIPHAPFQLAFPYFDTNEGERFYPFSVYSHRSVPNYVVNPDYRIYDPVYWLPMDQDNYKFIFSSWEKVFVKDTTLHLPSQQFTSVYISDDPAVDGEFKVLALSEEHRRTEGKVRVRFIHLSSDAGKIKVSRRDATGAEIHEDLSTGLTNGEVTEYLEIDTVGTSATNNNILLTFYDAENPDKILYVKALPAIPGSSFVAVILGNREATTRKLKSIGTTYETVEIDPNFRVSLRRIN